MAAPRPITPSRGGGSSIPAQAYRTAKVTGLQVPNKKNVAEYRHIPFVVPAGVSSGHKFNSNKVHEDGKLKSNACLQCIGAMAFLSRDKTAGRGMGSSNEYFCCMVDSGMGLGGSQCGRCLGLGKGGECIDPPAEAVREARAVVSLATAWNKLLAANPTTAPTSFVATNKATFEAIVKAAKNFNDVLNGLRRRGLLESTPSKKRKAEDMSADGKLGDLTLNLNRGQTALESKVDQLQTIIQGQANTIRSLENSIESLDRRSVVARGRDRWVVSALQAMISAHNEVDENADIAVEPFDTDAYDYETDHVSDDEQD